MGGDYCRYLAEIQVSQEDDKAKGKGEVTMKGKKNKSKEYYEKALKEAEANLNETHPTRLGLALNFSVCYYEILKDQDKACQLAKKAFDDAIEKLDTLGDATYKDSTLIMQLLRDNLTLWTSQNDENAEAAPPEP